MISGEVVAAAVAGAATAFVIAGAILLRNRSLRAEAARADAEVRPILFSGLDRGDFDPAVIAALTPVQRAALDAQARSLLPKL